ncbi:hypothetical protein QBC34DRAFT_87310 [Podospora aff. communis PSN243]|uniref:Cytochrome b561 domain-containing protein n=1 Tax=Podospora aff. communis PSN243 TaxID=3040156 RepID=A0AAV9GMU5_9PEZI|nr:hypothetical protein QBC34DRAFT_87310 [Podospora aff. communis PSN243]
MGSQQRVATAAVGAALFASVANAQYGGYGGGGRPGGSGSGSGSGFGNGNFGNFGNGAGFDIDAATRARTIHGILAALSMVVLFPLGSIFMRVIPGRFAIWIHAAAQMIAYLVYIAGVGLGIYLVRMVQIPFGGGTLLTNPNTSYHPIIGLVVLVFLFFQPILGAIHHAKYKKVGGRQIWSYLHLFNGRIFITLGIANGGLGLWMAGESDRLKTAYIAVAVVMWVLWMLSAVWGEWRRWRATKGAKPAATGKL